MEITICWPCLQREYPESEYYQGDMILIMPSEYCEYLHAGDEEAEAADRKYCEQRGK